MTSINVHDDVGQVKALEGVRNTITVSSSGVLAGLEVLVGDKVGQAVGLDDQGNGGVGVLLEDGDDGWYELVLKSCMSGRRARLLTVNVLGLVGGEITSSKFTVGGLGGAITAGKIVDDESGELVAGNIL